MKNIQGSWVKVMSTRPVWFDSQMVIADNARIEVRSLHKKKLEYPVSIDEP